MLTMDMSPVHEQRAENSLPRARGASSPMRNPGTQAHIPPASPTSGSRGSYGSNFYTVPSPQGPVAFRPPARSASPLKGTAHLAQSSRFTWQALGSNGALLAASPEADCRSSTAGGAPPDLSSSRQAAPRHAGDLQAWLNAAQNFEMNADFDVASAFNGTQLNLHDLCSSLKAVSIDAWTSQVIGDKLSLHRILRNLRIPQMPIHYSNEGAVVNRGDLDSFVLQHLCGRSSTPVAMKPTHLCNGTGVIFVGRVAPEDGPQPTINYLVHHLQKFLSQKPAAGESSLALKPGFIAQEKYDSVLGFDRPLELRVLILWGRARLATWWWGHSTSSEEQPRNVWLARNLASTGGFSNNDSWGLLHSYDDGEPAYVEALDLVLKQLPSMVVEAETVALAFGAPFLRADFFVGSERWGVKLNDIVYGSATSYLGALEDAQLAEDADAIVQILQEGHTRCRRRLPPEHFLLKLGVRGCSYSDMSIKDMDATLTTEDLPSASTRNPKPEQGLSLGTQNILIAEQAEPLAPSSSSKAEQTAKYKIGDEAEIWSKSQKVWSRGRVIKVGPATVTVSFTLPDGMLYAKELPPTHHDLRRIVDAPAIGEIGMIWSVGDEIEVWSNSRKQWGRGKIENVETREGGDNVVLARFNMPDGSVCEKEMWANCAELRRASSSSSAEPTSSNSSVAAPRKKSLAEAFLTNPSIQLDKPAAVQRSPSYKVIPPSSAATHVAAQGIPATQSAGSYVPPSASQQSRSYTPPAQTSVPPAVAPPIVLPASEGVQRSYSYVPPSAESTAAPHKATYMVPANELAAVQNKHPALAMPSPAVPTPNSSATSQTNQNNAHTSRASATPVIKGANYTGVTKVHAQKRPSSVPPQRKTAVHQKTTTVAPSWTLNANPQHCYVSLPAASVAGTVKTQPISAMPAGVQQKGVASNVLAVEDLAIGQGTPLDPTHPGLRSQLISRLGVSQNAVVKPMARAGGQNEGVWLLEDGTRSFVLKLVRNQNVGLIPTETQRFVKLAAEHPTMVSDPSLTFPRKIFRLKAAGGSFDLMLMPRAPGERVSDVVSILWAQKQKAKIMSIMERTGAFLKEFHIRYGNKQHCDFQASNIFYDDASGKFTLVDLADIGQQGIISERDTERFIGGLNILGKCFGQQFFQETKRAFQGGYNNGRVSQRQRTV